MVDRVYHIDRGYENIEGKLAEWGPESRGSTITMSLQAKKHNQAFLDIVNDAKSRVREINIEQYQRMKQAGEDHLLVDVREESEWSAGHAAGAMHLSKGVIERDIETKIPDHDKKLVSVLRRRVPIRARGG